MGLYTVPDFFHVRFGGRWPRIIAALAAVLCSFTYVVAQIYGVGLIASRLTGVQFEIGIMLGLGGVLLCSFLGGMRAITWTQVAQYVVLLLAFLIPVSWLAYKQLGNPVAPLVYGAADGQDCRYGRAAARLAGRAPGGGGLFAPGAGLRGAAAGRGGCAGARARKGARAHPRPACQNADVGLIVAASRELAAPAARCRIGARALDARQMHENYERASPWAACRRTARPLRVTRTARRRSRPSSRSPRRNFLALMFCLMVGTAGLPHLLTRYYTSPTVAGARASVAWSLFFIALLYLSAPALAVLVKFEVMNNLVGSSFDQLPNWMAQWARVDASLLSIEDVNGDGIVQFGEIRLGADLIMLATPELGGLPYVVSGLVAAGGLAAALSTADGLLLTISNALVRDLYFQETRRKASPEQRVILTKFTLLAVALAAAFVAALKPAEILPLVSASFSLAASAFVPVMVLGIFWRGTTRQGAVAGMLCGLGLAAYYMLSHVPACAPPGRAGCWPMACGLASSPFRPGCLVCPQGWSWRRGGEPHHPARARLVRSAMPACAIGQQEPFRGQPIPRRVCRCACQPAQPRRHQKSGHRGPLWMTRTPGLAASVVVRIGMGRKASFCSQ